MPDDFLKGRKLATEGKNEKSAGESSIPATRGEDSIGVPDIFVLDR